MLTIHIILIAHAFQLMEVTLTFLRGVRARKRAETDSRRDPGLAPTLLPLTAERSVTGKHLNQKLAMTKSVPPWVRNIKGRGFTIHFLLHYCTKHIIYKCRTYQLPVTIIEAILSRFQLSRLTSFGDFQYSIQILMMLTNCTFHSARSGMSKYTPIFVLRRYLEHNK